MMHDQTVHKPNSFGMVPTGILFGLAGFVLFIDSQWLIPYLAHNTPVEMVVWWFVFAGFGMFLPLVVVAYILLKKEKPHLI